MDLNFDQLHLFVEGMKNSRVQEAEENNSYEYGLNGRLYSKDGKLAYSSIQGTVSIYNNDKIVKYLGYYAFADALVVFVKYNQKGAGLGTVNTISEVIVGENVTIEIPFGQSQHNFTDELSVNATEETTTIAVVDIPDPEQPLLDSYDVLEQIQTLDLSSYYRLSGQSIPNYEICDIGGLNQVPEYNKEYADAIIVLTNNGYHAFFDRLVWVGNMNWDINRKITTVGIDENAYYKRVYFTDNLNPLRVVNLKDDNLWYRTAEEFSINQDTTLLQPTVKEIKDGGSIKAMSVQYAYILLTDNGQVTSFSPYSPLTYILKDDDGVDFEGGGIKEQTSKMVVVQCPIISLLYKEVQCIAIEYEADTIPTAIRNLGKKDVSSIVEFIHTGNEQEFDTSFTIDDIIETRHIWTYCNDITSKNNKLIAAGLRNKPYAVQEKYVEDLFLLKGWSDTGQTHNSLINPTPSTYKYFDPLNTELWVYVKKQLYKRFLFFGNVTLTLNNRNNPNEKRSISFESSSDQYIDYIDRIADWAIALDLVGFDNLKIRKSDDNILFYPENDLLQTDMSDYYFTTSISQVIIDFDNEYGLLTPSVNNSQLIYGGQSVGFNKGTGVRISWEEKKEPIMDKAPEIYEGGPVLNLLTPTLKRTFVKGEIYRFSIQFYKNGSPLFAIVLGDLQTPEIGDIPKYIDNDGNIAIGDELYANQSVENNQLMAHRLEMRVEVRVPCQFKDYVDSYQIQYVERTENNRTILAQGISAPIVRLNKFVPISKSGAVDAPTVYDRWTLPFNGGPLYSINGLITYDEQGENLETDTEFDWEDSFSKLMLAIFQREIVHRKMFYFDSPDLIYGRVSDVNISNATAKVLGRVNTDHTGHLIRSRAVAGTWPLLRLNDDIHEYYTNDVVNEVYDYKQASFSRKISKTYVSGNDNAKPWYTNISVFSEFTHLSIESPVEKASNLLLKGEVIPSLVLGSNFEFSNNALTLFAQHAYNGSLWMSGAYINRKGGSYASETGQSSNASPGYPTVVLRTEDNIFTDEFIGAHRLSPIYSLPFTNDGADKMVDIDKTYTKKGVPNTDAHAIINLKMNNENSVYGGRNKYAYSKNVFIPLGKVIPIQGSQGDTQSQIFNCEGDFYTSLFLRTKNDFSEMRDLLKTTMHQRHQLVAKMSIEDYNRGNAWSYAVILETEVESRLTDQYRFFKSEGSLDFESDIQETINSAYFKKDNLRIYSPVPYNFKDDPLMVNMLSASKTKLNGDYIDAWTTFMLNEFYELEKSKGIITNVTNWEDQILAIQERETSQVNIDTTDFVTTQNGENVAIKKGDGRTFTSHKKLSDFGTSIRRALAQGEFGICFVDEYNKAFVKFGESLSLPLEIQMKLRELFEYNKIIDTEGYYDVKYKETNIRIRTEQGITYMLSYNELLQRFNGWIAYDNDIYMMYDKRVFAPTCHAVNVTVLCAQITSPLTANYQIGTYFEYQITATNNPVFFNAIDLPTGLTINKSTGLISGYLNTPGTYIITIYADNDVCGDQVILTIDSVQAKLSNEIDNNGTPNITADGLATVTGTLTAWFNGPLEGVSNGSTTLFAPSLSGSSSLSGISNGSSEVILNINNLHADSNGFSQVTGMLSSNGILNGSIEDLLNGTTLTGALIGRIFISGTFNGQSTTSGILSSIIVASQIVGISESFSICQAFMGSLNFQSIILGAQSPYVYDAETNNKNTLTIPSYNYGEDIAHTENKLWSMGAAQYIGGGNPYQTLIKEWDITLNPFQATFNRDIIIPYAAGAGLCAIDDTTLILGEIPNNNSYSFAQKMNSVDISAASPISTYKFSLPWKANGVLSIKVAGDYILTDTVEPKLILTLIDESSSLTYICQIDWNTGTLEIFKLLIVKDQEWGDWELYGNPFGMAMQNGKLYIFDASNNTSVYEIGLVFPYKLNYVHLINDAWISGASQIRSVLTSILEFTIDATAFGTSNLSSSTLGTLPGQMASHEVMNSLDYPEFGSTGASIVHNSTYKSIASTYSPFIKGKSILQIYTPVTKTGNPIYDLSMEIWSLDGAGKPLALLEASINVINSTNILNDTDKQRFYFTGQGYFGNIALVCQAINVVTLNASNYCRFMKSSWQAQYPYMITKTTMKSTVWSALENGTLNFAIIGYEVKGTLTNATP